MLIIKRFLSCNTSGTVILGKWDQFKYKSSMPLVLSSVNVKTVELLENCWCGNTDSLSLIADALHCRNKYKKCLTIVFFPSVKQLIFFILKFINSWNNRFCDVKTCLCKCNSLWGFVIKDLVPINWYINICTAVKLSCNYSWRTKDRPEIVHEILFICALGDNMNNLTCYCTLLYSLDMVCF